MPTASSGAAPPTTALLTYAQTAHFPPSSDAPTDYARDQRLRKVNYDLQRDPPPQTHCARSLGAKRFATLYDDQGAVYSELGQPSRAAQAFSRAIECNPRAGFLHIELSQELLHLGRFSQARTEAQRQVQPGNFAAFNLLVQLAFITGRWDEAAAQARQAVAAAPDDQQATYWQCFLWLAQKRAGIIEPVAATRVTGPGWPRPILEHVQGKLSEAQLLQAVRAESDPRRQREILCEALFYSGELYLAAGDEEVARRYFRATTALQLRDFIEYHLALAELAKPAATGSLPAQGRIWPEPRTTYL